MVAGITIVKGLSDFARMNMNRKIFSSNKITLILFLIVCLSVSLVFHEKMVITYKVIQNKKLLGNLVSNDVISETDSKLNNSGGVIKKIIVDPANIEVIRDEIVLKIINRGYERIDITADYSLEDKKYSSIRSYRFESLKHNKYIGMIVDYQKDQIVLMTGQITRQDL